MQATGGSVQKFRNLQANIFLFLGAFLTYEKELNSLVNFCIPEQTNVKPPYRSSEICRRISFFS